MKADVAARAAENAGGTAVEKAKARTRGMRGAPPMLEPSSTKPIDVTFPPDTSIKKIYAALGAAAGINVIYDPQLKDDRFSLELRGMTFQKALETTMRQAGHFYKVIDEHTILIAQDTQQNRKEYEDLVIRTFFLSNGDVKDVSQMVRSILDLRRLAVIPQLNAIVIRDTADKVAVAERLIDVNDKAKAEVVVDVELLQINTQQVIDLGAQYSRQISATVVPGAAGGATAAATSLPWNAIKALGINDFMFSVPAITFNFIKDNTDAELLAKPQLRIAEGEKAQLVIGDRIPIPVTTINTQQAIGGTGVIPITSFQYQDVGIKIDMEPRVHHNKEVSLKLTIEVSQLNGSVPAADGTSQPIIGTRTITSTIRLKDGETNFLAGLIRKDITKTKTSIPFLGDLPLIGQLFTNVNNTDKRTDVFLTLTPHIIRAPQITEEDLVPIWVGTENNVSFSGLNTRLESPNATGSPFDAPAVPQRVQPRPIAPPPPAALPIMQGSGPNDPFKHPTPAPAPVPANPRLPNATSAPAPNASLAAPAAAVAETSAADAAAGKALADPVPAAAPAPAAAPGGTVASAPAAAALALEATSAADPPGRGVRREPDGRLGPRAADGARADGRMESRGRRGHGHRARRMARRPGRRADRVRGRPDGRARARALRARRGGRAAGGRPRAPRRQGLGRRDGARPRHGGRGVDVEGARPGPGRRRHGAHGETGPMIRTRSLAPRLFARRARDRVRVHPDPDGDDRPGHALRRRAPEGDGAPRLRSGRCGRRSTTSSACPTRV